MSHTVDMSIDLRDVSALEKACKRLSIKFDKEEKNVKLYSSTEKGMAVHLKDWSYPVVVQKDGKIKMDNYNGHWGKQERLTELQAFYGVEKAKIEAARKGYQTTESVDKHGNPKLTIYLSN